MSRCIRFKITVIRSVSRCNAKVKRSSFEIKNVKKFDEAARIGKRASIFFYDCLSNDLERIGVDLLYTFCFCLRPTTAFKCFLLKRMVVCDKRRFANDFQSQGQLVSKRWFKSKMLKNFGPTSLHSYYTPLRMSRVSCGDVSAHPSQFRNRARKRVFQSMPIGHRYAGLFTMCRVRSLLVCSLSCLKCIRYCPCPCVPNC
jgi:hypothetical protein